MKACAVLNVPLVKVLLESKANADYTNSAGNSALHVTLLASNSERDVG